MNRLTFGMKSETVQSVVDDNTFDVEDNRTLNDGTRTVE